MSGATGMTGMTGVTGPTAPNVTANYQYSSGPQVTTAAQIVYPLLGITGEGTAITQNADGTLTLAPNQAYYVDFSMDTRVQPGSTAGAGLYLNGGLVGGTGVSVSNNGATFVDTSLSGNGIVRTGATAGTLALRVASGPQASQFQTPAYSMFKIA
ncbi:hypothetical protein ACE41H_25105 [Paenibacillus enshidis]|uniref:BclA C-terminal domain-containing protein n=1 Tax=Paenibacillus enshidis TaxID=1458439 RepID=A0ABV5B0M6_9BACL